jgi:hypothetical protein
VLQQCKSERRIHADLLRCVLDFFAERWKKVREVNDEASERSRIRR